MAAAVERRLEPEPQNFVGQAGGDDAPAHRQDVGIVVLARQPRRVQIVAERGANAGHLIGGDLLALSAATEYDAALGTPLGDRTRDTETDRWIVDRRVVIGAVIVNDVAESLQRLLQMLFQQKPGVIGADGDTHNQQLYYTLSAVSSQLSVF